MNVFIMYYQTQHFFLNSFWWRYWRIWMLPDVSCAVLCATRSGVRWWVARAGKSTPSTRTVPAGTGLWACCRTRASSPRRSSARSALPWTRPTSVPSGPSSPARSADRPSYRRWIISHWSPYHLCPSPTGLRIISTRLPLVSLSSVPVSHWSP